MTSRSPIRWALGLVGRLRVAAKVGVAADLDATINNVSPSAPICEGVGSLAEPCPRIKAPLAGSCRSE